MIKPDPLLCNIPLDIIFVKIEKRGLTFLLQGEYLEQYKTFLNRPVEYREYIRALEDGGV